MNTVFIIVGIIAIVVSIIYNSLVLKRHTVENAFAGIDAQLKKRYDLIPNLVEVAKQYMIHEQETLTRITALRTTAINEEAPQDDRIAAAGEMVTALNRVILAIEAYPELRAEKGFNFLARTLNEVEEQISAARRSYNAAVTEFNTSIHVFPNNMVATLFGFKDRNLYTITDVERVAPNVGDQMKPKK